MDPDLMSLYNQQMREFAKISDRCPQLETAMGIGSAQSRLCGSEITFQVNLEKGRISELGWHIKACLFGQAVTGIIATFAIGLSPPELRLIRQYFHRLLKEDRPMPDQLPDFLDLAMQPWQKLDILRPAHPLKPRHKSALIAFDAVLKACDQASQEN